MRQTIRTILPIAILVLAALRPLTAAETDGPVPVGLFETTAAGPGIPGEFEPQAAVLLTWETDDTAIHPTIVRIIQAIWQKVPIILLVADGQMRDEAGTALQRANIPAHAVRFVQAPFDTIWARDYGPTVIRSATGQHLLVDAEYDWGLRAKDDEVPSLMASLLQMPTIRAPLTLEGGNLLSNGAGLCLTTTITLENNSERGYGAAQVAEILRTHYSLREVVFLEPLMGEGTGHVDMFATFTSPNTVVVGQYAPEIDPVNAAVLDRNAERLAKVQTPSGPLQVVRIPMPPHSLDCWRTYTNVLYANGTVLMPVYADLDWAGREQALATYRRLLPDWNIVEVDCERLIECGGAIHCVVLNLSAASRMPEPGAWEIPDPAPLEEIEVSHESWNQPVVGQEFEIDATEIHPAYEHRFPGHIPIVPLEHHFSDAPWEIGTPGSEPNSENLPPFSRPLPVPPRFQGATSSSWRPYYGT